MNIRTLRQIVKPKHSRNARCYSTIQRFVLAYLIFLVQFAEDSRVSSLSARLAGLQDSLAREKQKRAHALIQ